MTLTTFEGKPEWYGGPQGILKSHIEDSRDLSKSKFQPYRGQRVAGFSPQQLASFNLAERYAQPAPQYGQAQGAISGAIGQDVYGQNVQPYLEEGAAPAGQEDINQYLNPYRQEVLENIGRLGSRNLIENILPNVQNKFIGAGQYGSSQHQNLTNRAIRDTQEGISQAQANALHGGFGTALQAAQSQKGRQLEAGQLASQAGERQAGRQLQGAEALQNLAGAEQQQGLRGVAALNQVGGQQQQQEQNLLNVPYSEFKRELEYPFYRQAHLTSVINGLPSPGTSQFASEVNPVPPSAPQASPYSQFGGLVQSYAGMANQRQGYAEGGVVKQLSRHRHMADGGSLSPIQSGANAAIDTAELKSMRDFATNQSRPQIDPFWAGIARSGAAMAAKRQPGVLANLGESAQEGLTEYHGQLANQDKRGLESAKIMEMIDSTKRLQAERNRIHALELEKFGETKRHQQASEGLQASKDAREAEEHKWKGEHRNILGNAKEGFYKYDPESESLESIKGGPEKELDESSKAEMAAYKKSDQDGLADARTTIHNSDEIESILNELDQVNKNLKTGGYRGSINKYTPGWGSPVGRQTDINRFKNLTARLQLLQEQLKSSGRPLASRLALIGSTKSLLEDTTEANDINIKTALSQIGKDREKAKFINKNVKLGKKDVVHVNDAESAFDEYQIRKNEYEKEGKAKGRNDKFSKTPQQFLKIYLDEKRGGSGQDNAIVDPNLIESGISAEVPNKDVTNKIENLSEEDIDKMIEAKRNAT